MYTIQRVSENAFLISVTETSLSLTVQNKWIAHWFMALSKMNSDEVQVLGEFELTPSYNTLLVEFEIHRCPYAIKQSLIKKLDRERLECKKESVEFGDQTNAHYTTHVIPVCFELPNNSQYPNDLESFGQAVDVESSFCNKPYRIYSVGFLPNFAYLGEVDDSLQQPRLTTPRNRVPRGAVAIADKQAAIYPIESRGGWNILGYTPVDVNTLSEPFKIGESVIFEKISKQTFLMWNRTASEHAFHSSSALENR